MPVRRNPNTGQVERLPYNGKKKRPSRALPEPFGAPGMGQVPTTAGTSATPVPTATAQQRVPVAATAQPRVPAIPTSAQKPAGPPVEGWGPGTFKGMFKDFYKRPGAGAYKGLWKPDALNEFTALTPEERAEARADLRHKMRNQMRQIWRSDMGGNWPTGGGGTTGGGGGGTTGGGGGGGGGTTTTTTNGGTTIPTQVPPIPEATNGEVLPPPAVVIMDPRPPRAPVDPVESMVDTTSAPPVPQGPGFPRGGGSEPNFGYGPGGFGPKDSPPNRQIFAGQQLRKAPSTKPTKRGATRAQGVRVGEDPLSRNISGALRGMLRSGGATPFEKGIKTNITNYLRDVAGQGGPGGGDPQVGGLLSSVMAQQGAGGVPADPQVGGSLADLIATQGRGTGTMPLRSESLREELDNLRSSQVQGLESRLASRGLMGSGFERTGLEGIERELGAMGASRLREFAADDVARADQRFMNALASAQQESQFGRGRADQRLGQAIGAAQQESQFGRGLAEQSLADRRQALLGGLGLGVSEAGQQAQNLLSTIGLGTQRQDMLSQIALQNLQQSAAFNQALQQAGIDREVAMENIRQGRISSLLPLLQAQLQLPQIAQRGFM